LRVEQSREIAHDDDYRIAVLYSLTRAATFAPGKNMVIRIEAHVANALHSHRAVVATDGAPRDIDIPPRATGYGSSANGGELLCLALATCYCNDVYREAATRAIEVSQVTVHVDAQFGAPGEPASLVRYRADVTARAAEDDIRALMVYTDSVAEIQNTLRRAVPVEFTVGAIVAHGAA
jgi:organic hydroperoxide reductase OsmC/OhrA